MTGPATHVEDKVTPTWMMSAACADRALGSARTRTRVFFPPSSNSANPTGSNPAVWTAAKTVCSTCPVAGDCLDHAIEHGETDGVWGGLDPAERRLEARRVRRRSTRKATA